MNSDSVNISGLSANEVAERRAKGLVNTVESSVSRSYKDIFIDNFLNWFYLVFMVVGILLYLAGDLYSALSATGIIVLNIMVSTVQEIKAKRRLDKIAITLRPKVTVIREGKELEIDQSEIVMDDIIRITAGDQVLVDGKILYLRSLEMDEAALTGESSSVRKIEGELVYSGSFCVTGEALFRTTALGGDTYASNMLVSARKYKRKKTPLQMETAAVTKLLISFAAVMLLLYFVSKLMLGTFTTFLQEVKAAAVILDIVPMALFLLVTLTYMIAAIRMADSGVLLQRSNSVESMSHVDTVCMDKTGTITSNRLLFEDAVYFIDEDEAKDLMRLFVGATGSRNRTIEVLDYKYGSEKSNLIEEVQFSSQRKFSAVRVEKDKKETALYLGAWDVLREYVNDPGYVTRIVKSMSKKGLRTIVLCKSLGTHRFDEDYKITGELVVVCVIAIADELRPDCRETMEVFMENNIDIKVISGDDPDTVNSLFDMAEIPGERKIISGDELDKLDEKKKTEVILNYNIFGRMRPDHKETIIDTLKINNRYVAMVGDGVNDVKAIKSAQVGISLESGSGATRGAADMVLVNDDFSALPKALREGRRTVTGMRDILKIYLARNFTLVTLILFTMLMLHGVTLQPIQNTVYALMTVSVAAFLMTVWAKPDVNKDRILPGVIRFTIPTALTTGIFGILVYIIFYLGTGDLINIDYHGMAASAGLLYEDLFVLHMRGSGIDSIIFETGIAEINARNAMFFFIVLAGILNLLMVQPIHKVFSVDGKVVKDFRPTGLVILMLILFCFIFFVPFAKALVITFLWTAVFPAVYYIPIILLTVVWFFTTRKVLRGGYFKFVSDHTERWFDKRLKEEVRKSMEEDGDAVEAQGE
jgi:cation-transporting ATPase E